MTAIELEASASQRPYHHGDLRAALLAAAEAELAETGIERFSLRSVAKRAGVSHAAPAHHFGDTGGLLTALAAEGFERFLATQRAREAAAPGQPDRIVAAGLGYIAFALAHPALFRLMFASERPDFAASPLVEASRAAYGHLIENVAEVRGADPVGDEGGMTDVTAAWAIVHGLADLLQAGRLSFLRSLPAPEREATMAAIIRRVLPALTGCRVAAFGFRWTPPAALPQTVATPLRSVESEAAMRSTRVVHVISAHAEGEVDDVIVGGVAPPPGDTVWEQSRWIARDGRLRSFVLNEPRGGVFRHVNLLVPPKSPLADAAFIIMEPEDTPPMSGSNAICVATVLLDAGILPMKEPVTELTLEAPGGLVKVRAACRGGKAERIFVQNLPSFAARLDARLEVEGPGTLTVDTAYGGDSFVIVDADVLGLSLVADEARDIARLGVRITDAANAALGFEHPTNPDWRHISFCLFAGPLGRGPEGADARAAVAIQPGKVDRSPTGTALSARMAVLHARGQMRSGETLTATSLIGSSFTGRILGETDVGGRKAILPEISGRAWITGLHQHMLDPSDPWPEGYRLADTWGAR